MMINSSYTFRYFSSIFFEGIILRGSRGGGFKGRRTWRLSNQ